MINFRFSRYWKLWGGAVGTALTSALSIAMIFWSVPDGVTATGVIDAITKVVEAGDAAIVAINIALVPLGALVGVWRSPKNAD
jgi:hypothetical protein